MSAYEFDELTKSLATGTSRRGLLKLVGKVVAAGAAVGALTAIGSGGAGAVSGTCTNCFYGPGNPCNQNNASSVLCVPPGASCPATNNGKKFCGSSTFHCPSGRCTK
jgi:hypothetical protein